MKSRNILVQTSLITMWSKPVKVAALLGNVKYEHVESKSQLLYYFKTSILTELNSDFMCAVKSYFGEQSLNVGNDEHSSTGVKILFQKRIAVPSSSDRG